LTTDRQELGSEPIRIDLRRGVKALLLTLIIPVTAAVVVDITSGTLPFLTIAAVIICIPLATIVVNRTVLAEFNRVVTLVAPPEVEELPTPEGTLEGTPEGMLEGTADSAVDSASTGSISNDWSLDGQPFTEGAQKHHG
jgi:hypothetical protein